MGCKGHIEQSVTHTTLMGNSMMYIIHSFGNIVVWFIFLFSIPIFFYFCSGLYMGLSVQKWSKCMLSATHNIYICIGQILCLTDYSTHSLCIVL